MANLNDIFPSRYLKAHELQGHDVAVTIASVAFEPMGRAREIQPVVYFVGKVKGLKLNKTMAQAIAQIAGSTETEDWTGVAVCVYATFADFGKQTFPVVRIKAPVAKPRAVEGRRA